jgi:two-component system LytT family response regulator
MEAIRILIVDDEPLARRRVRKLLNGRRDVTIVGESANGREAVAAIRSQRPDVVFLDVQMPVLDGFGALAELAGDEMPVVVFTTAYDQYALRAFEVHALDYLLKPFDDERFEQALERARAQVQRSKADDLGARLQELLADHGARAGGPGEAADPERLVVKSGGRITFLDLDEIDWIEAEGSYVNLHAGKRSHLLRETMNGLEARLPEDRFLRVHRSTIVNLGRVRELQERHGDYRVVLEDGRKLAVSQRYREKLHKALGL